MNKSYTFFFHYNKPESKKVGKPQITVHYKGVCHLCDNIIVNVPTFGCLRKNQPMFIIKGSCKEMIFNNGIITIN